MKKLKYLVLVILTCIVITGVYLSIDNGAIKDVKSENMKVIKEHKAVYIENSKFKENTDTKGLKINEYIIKSKYANENMKYKVVVPEKFEHGKVYPMVIFLHGIGDCADDWINKAKTVECYSTLLKRKEIEPMVLVFAESGYNNKSWYVNWKKDESKKYEDYFIKELIPDVEKKYSCGGKQSLRGICGFSMGGYGAINLIMRNSNIFKCGGSFAGAINLYRLSFSNKKGGIFNMLYIPEAVFGGNEKKKQFVKVFGSMPALWKENNPFNLADSRSEELKKNGVKLLFDVGENDLGNYHMVDQWNDMVNKLSKNGIEYEGYLVKGEEHSWEYVAKRMETMLKFNSKNLR